MMPESEQVNEIAAGRLEPQAYAENFADLHPALSRHEALVESDRCYFCYDAPCVTACPTSIDIPLFIREINRSGCRVGGRVARLSRGRWLGALKQVFGRVGCRRVVVVGGRAGPRGDVR
jgi:hypothetical protein